MAFTISVLQVIILVIFASLSWGCSIDIDRSETSGSDTNEKSENLLPKTENQTSAQNYIDETYLELSIVNDKELAVGKESTEYTDYKIQIRLYEIRCLQNDESYKKKPAGWTPKEDCLVYAKTIITTADGSLKVKDAPYGVYFLDLRIISPDNQLVAQGSDEVVIVRDALNESKIMVKGENEPAKDGERLGKEDEIANSAAGKPAAG